ncbi:acetate--CoA ligase family protein [Paradevosia shaoguanensis]|uniref:acetate--CoA ligase family protein n=1 Tax=Paradevosia shaoguanensis TaxID=1335043 RepID=UPI001933AD94|nr:acetate--CoA ligase family protein [Paradevosia shaoguanensis]
MTITSNLAVAETQGARDNVARLLSPRSIAMIGASNNMTGIGGRVFANLARAFKGPLYPVNPKDAEIQGHRAYKRVGEVGQPIDMAVIALSAAHVIGAIEEVAAAGIGGVVILSSGFAEAGDEGKAMQARLREVLDRTGVRAIGPNCIGYMNNHGGVMANFALSPQEPMPKMGAVALVSQSGGLGSFITTKSLEAGIGLGWYVSTGNEVDLNVAGTLRYLVEQPDVGVLLAFCETLRDPEIFIETAKRAQALDKPLIILKAGRSDVAAKAAMSHTASVVGSAEVFDAVCRQHGVFVAESMEHMIDLAMIFQGGRRAKGDRVGVLTASGGTGVLLADESAQAGLSLPPLGEDEKQAFYEFLPTPFFGSLNNPVDVTAQPSPHPNASAEIFGRMLGSPSFDMVAAVSWAAPPYLDMITAQYNASDKPLGVLMTVPSAQLAAAGVPHFTDARRLARALRAMSDFSSQQAARAETAYASDPARARRVADLLAKVPAAEAALMEHQGKQIFAEYGVPVTRETLVTDADGAARAAAEIGGKVVIKGMSYAIPHKSDKGAIRVGLAGDEAIRREYGEMLADIARLAPEAGLEGVLVQEMVPARMELVCGMRRDPVFGPIVALGLGGVLIEIIAETVLLRPPFGRAEAIAAIDSLCGGRLTNGRRGLTAEERERVADIVLGIAALAIDHPEISEIDVNPIRVDNGKAVAADALIVLERGTNG